MARIEGMQGGTVDEPQDPEKMAALIEQDRRDMMFILSQMDGIKVVNPCPPEKECWCHDYE